MDPDPSDWRAVAGAQGGLITRAQLLAAGVDRRMIARRIARERWLMRAPGIVGTTTGELTREQLCWSGVLNGGQGAMLAGLTAAELGGLANWHRDEVTVLVPYSSEVPPPIAGVRYVRTRRAVQGMRIERRGLPVLRLEPAVLLFAAADRSPRTAQGVVAAAVQQQLTSAGALRDWIDRLAPLPRAPLLRQLLDDVAGGAQSLAEVDLARMCRRCGLMVPLRQVKRRDAEGRLRFTDCEWRRSDGRILVLEVDGAFHMDVEHWEDDLARQRALSAEDRLIVHCTARELRDEPDRIARDLRRLGVPRAA